MPRLYIHTPIEAFKGIIVLDAFPTKTTTDISIVRVPSRPPGRGDVIVGTDGKRLFTSQAVQSAHVELGAVNRYGPTLAGLVKLGILTVEQLDSHTRAVTERRDRAEQRSAAWDILRGAGPAGLDLTDEQREHLQRVTA